MTPWFVLAFSALFCCTYLSRRLLESYRRRKVIFQHACQPAKQHGSVPHPSGESFTARERKSWKEGKVTAFYHGEYQRLGSTTYELEERNHLNNPFLYTCDLEISRALQADPLLFHKDTRGAHKSFPGAGVANTNGAQWRAARATITPLFQRAENLDLKHFARLADTFLGLLPQDDSTFDAQPLIRKLFLDSSTEFIFGKSLGALSDTSGLSDQFLQSFDRAASGARERALKRGLVTNLEYMLGIELRGSSWRRDCKVVQDFIDDSIVKHRRMSPGESERSRYILMEAMADKISDDVVLRHQLIDFFILARETVGMAFSNMLWLIARSPEYWDKIQAQAREAGLTSHAALKSSDALKKAPLLRWCVQETLRLHSPIMRQRRITTQDTVLSRGGGQTGEAPLFVPKNTTIMIDLFPSCRNEAVWGPDAEAFRPERFGTKRPAWNFAPFGIGPRQCPAHEMVVVQLMYLLLRLTEMYETIESRDSRNEFIESATNCLVSKHGCVIGLHPTASN